jgi:type I restriction enzyme S subunit
MDPVYALFALRFVTPEILAKGRGATFAEVNSELMEEVTIPYCELHQQRVIASVLERADTLRRVRRFAASLHYEMQDALFQEMCVDGVPSSVLSGEDLLADVPDAIRTGPFGSQLLHSEFTNSGVAVLGIDNVVNNRFAWAQRRFITVAKYEQLRRYTVRPGDVLISIMGTCGRCAVVPDDVPVAINTKHLCCITLNRDLCLPVYLHDAFLFHPDVLRQIGVSQKGAIMDGLNMGIIKSLNIPVPPMIVQQRYAEMVAKRSQVFAGYEEGVRQAEHLCDSLSHAIFERGALPVDVTHC